MIFSIFLIFFVLFFAPSESRFSNRCIRAKYCPILTDHTSMEILFIQLSDDWPLRLVLCSRVIYCHESGCHSPHYNCTSPMDYNSHHSLHYDTHIPIHHCTNHTAVANHSLTLIVLPHLHLIHSGWHFWAFTIPSDCYFCAWPRTVLSWNSEPVLVTSTPAWYCLRLCSASDIPVIARWPLPVWFCLCLNK